MCQLNLYLVPKKVPTAETIRIFEKYNLNISISSHYKIGELTEEYNFYANNGYCDCGSIISRLKDEKVENFSDYKIKRKNKDAEILSKMKMLKSEKNYKLRVSEYEQKKQKLFGILECSSEYIRDYEIFETEKILTSSQKEKKSKDFEKLYAKLDEMCNGDKNYQKASKEYFDFINENRDLDESIYYDIEEQERLVYEYDFSDLVEEYNILERAYYEIIKLTNEICIYPFWLDGEKEEIKARKVVGINNLDISDLIFLPHRNLLVIER